MYIEYSIWRRIIVNNLLISDAIEIVAYKNNKELERT